MRSKNHNSAKGLSLEDIVSFVRIGIEMEYMYILRIMLGKFLIAIIDVKEGISAYSMNAW